MKQNCVVRITVMVFFVVFIAHVRALAQEEAGRQPALVDDADPMIGAKRSRWILHPGPTRPFGMVKLAPDNEMGKTLSSGGDRYGGGFDPGRNWIHGFSHLHSWTISGLSLMPRTGNVTNQRRPATSPRTYPAIYEPTTQEATPAHYEVSLPEQNIDVRMTPTTRAAMHEYTFPRSASAHIVITFAGGEYGAEIKDADIRRVSDREIVGYVKMDNNYFRDFQQYTHYFVLQFDKPFKRMAGWNGDNRSDIEDDVQRVTGDANRFGVAPVFQTDDGEPIRVKTGISFVSIESARNNLRSEIGSYDSKPHGWNYDEIRRAGREQWNQLFRRIDVTFPAQHRKRNRRKFYTNLFRAYGSRTIMSDANGKYTDMFEHVRRLDNPDDPMLGSDAFWNTFWNLNQLWTLVTPDVTRKWVRSLLRTYDDGGWLPKGPAGLEYSGIMRGVHTIPLIVAAYQHGIRNFNHETAYDAMKHAMTTPGQSPAPGKGGSAGARNLAEFIEHEYVPADRGRTSDTMEYAYDYGCLGTYAEALGKHDDATTFSRRAGYWKNTFDREGVKYLRRRKTDGTWVLPASEYDPHSDKSVTEGTLWQYSWFVPHDVPSLVNVMGRDRFVQRLKNGFQQAQKSDFRTGQRGEFNRGVNHGNQPNMQAAYLFNYAGAPWRTQKWARAIMEQYYGTGPDAWPGDEDQGQMGAWFVMSALGLFQTDGGCRAKPIYEIGSPLVKEATIQLDSTYYSGDTLTIRAKNNSPENKYIQSASFNGKPLTKPWIRGERVLSGGELVLEMGPEPNKQWGRGLENAPPAPEADRD